MNANALTPSWKPLAVKKPTLRLSGRWRSAAMNVAIVKYGVDAVIEVQRTVSTSGWTIPTYLFGYVIDR
jgi:hypothetical protein